MRRPSRRLMLPIAALFGLVAQAAPAGEILVARLSGSDVVLDAAGPGLTCAGDLYGGEVADLYGGISWAATLLATGVTCPYTVAGDGALRGAETGRYYFVRDPMDYSRTTLAFLHERHLDPQLLPGGGPAGNAYFVSLPLLSTEPDVANTAAPEANKCVGDADGPSAPDGLVNADDLICRWWTSRSSGQGSMMISWRDELAATWRDRTGFVDPSTGRVTFVGPFTGALPRDDGYMVTVDGAPGTQNHFIVAGGHEPWSSTGRTISGATDTMFVLNMPYHGLYRKLSETLCGLEGVDWLDIDGNGPETCDRGLFDEAHDLTVVAYDHVFDGEPTDGRYVSMTAMSFPGGNVFGGRDRLTAPADTVLVVATRDQLPRTFLPPTCEDYF